MSTNDIIEKINQIQINKEASFTLFTNELDKVNRSYYGLSDKEHAVFIIESTNVNAKPLIQSSIHLDFFFNIDTTFQTENKVLKKKIHILECKSGDEEIVKAFVRLTQAFMSYELAKDQENLFKLFTTLTTLFMHSKQSSENELQGLFAELYVIYYFKDVNIIDFWQSKDRMKYDFYVNENKRIDVKSTLKPVRIHHFKHEQLLSDIFDIKIASLMLQKSDNGLSLMDLVEFIYERYSSKINIISHIEKLIKNVSQEMIDNIRYDETLLKNNLRIYDANDIPHFSDLNPEGIFNAEYDSDLSNIKNINEKTFIKWIGEQKNV